MNVKQALSGHEVELKFRVDDRAAAGLLIRATRLGDFDSVGNLPRTVRLEDRYVDTAGGALAWAGYAVRLRQTATGTIVSVKSLASTTDASGAVRRAELEGPADGASEPADWPDSAARSMVLEHGGDGKLSEVVTIRQVRLKQVMRAAAARVELSLDDVEVILRGATIGRFTELEAELLDGDADALGSLAAVLGNAPGLHASTTSKLDTAIALRDGRDAAAKSDRKKAAKALRRASSEAGDAAPPSAAADDPPSRPGPDLDASRLVVGKTPGVTIDDHVGEAGRKVMRFHLARMIDREPGVRSGNDMEDVHAMRVATRRQRAAWRVFGASFRPGRTKRFRSGLRDIASRLGAVRDLDVLIEAVDQYRSDLPTTEQRALEPLLAAWRTHRDEARVLLMRELDSEGYRRWLDDYRDFVRTEGAAVLPVGPTQPHRIRDTTASRIWAAYEQVRGYEPVLRWADVETLHELRIAGKWLRYSLEFVREALGDESAALIARVTSMQDHLGLMNDADVAAHMARSFLVDHAGDLSALETGAIGRYLVSREREVTRLQRSAGPTWRGVAGVSFRRALGRVVAAL